MTRTRIVIMGAAGRDFHNFLTCYRDDPSVEVVAFTANQIPGIECRTFPPELAGSLYPDGIPIFAEEGLPTVMRDLRVDRVVFAYSDVSHEEVMHRASLTLACGADFELLGPSRTMLRSTLPVISVCAVRTGAGKSGVSKHLWSLLTERGLRAVDIRHPMPYRDLTRMRVERYASRADLDAFGCTIEEREEFEQFIDLGAVVYAGVDYHAVLRTAETEADVIIWDGGNNDLPFVRPDLEIVVMDPHRAGHELRYHPGEANFLRANVLVINKVDTAEPGDVERLRQTAALHNPEADIVLTASAITVAEPERIAGKRVLVVEDGPTVTHGGMAFGAGTLAAERHGAAEVVDPRPHAVGSIRDAFDKYPHLTHVLPAVGYSPEQLADLKATIAATPCDLVVSGTPIDLARLLAIETPVLRALYAIEDAGEPTLAQVLDAFLAERGLSHAV